MTRRRAPVGIMRDAELRPSSRAEHIMSMPALRQHHWTNDEVERLIESRSGLAPRYELADGALLVTPAPSGRHQRIVFRLSVLLHDYVTRHRLGEVRLGPGEVRLAPQVRFEPDVYVIPAVDGRLPRANDPVTRVLLAAEVVSAGSARHDRITKRRFYQSHGVPDYWVIDGDAEAFEMWHPGDARAVLIDDRVRWRPSEIVPPFELDVIDFFADVADEADPDQH